MGRDGMLPGSGFHEEGYSPFGYGQHKETMQEGLDELSGLPSKYNALGQIIMAAGLDPAYAVKKAQTAQSNDQKLADAKARLAEINRKRAELDAQMQANAQKIAAQRAAAEAAAQKRATVQRNKLQLQHAQSAQERSKGGATLVAGGSGAESTGDTRKDTLKRRKRGAGLSSQLGLNV